MRQTGRRLRGRGLPALVVAFLVLAAALLYFRQEGVAQNADIGLDTPTTFPVDI